MNAPETIRIFQVSMALLIAETILNLLQSYMGRNSMLNAALKS